MEHLMQAQGTKMIVFWNTVNQQRNKDCLLKSCTGKSSMRLRKEKKRKNQRHYNRQQKKEMLVQLNKHMYRIHQPLVQQKLTWKESTLWIGNFMKEPLFLTTN
ncbi:hypothetical protein DPMN_121842 [Dreissena polymorpha]|uniref:Uncharacterized protein n=1 Tax=Dreissena polymorpha TaxID=45954 RepID=A0A9D4JTI8_DREPO|nr:hypothetical protein DPMN_121842 [Dreissena polymorpha]